MPRHLKTLIAALGAGAVLAAAPSAAETVEKGHVKVKDVWARATPPKAPSGAVFMTLRNTGTKDDRLVAAEADVAETVELHTHVKVDGVMKMRPVPAIAVPGGKTVTLEPGGLHVMLIDLTERLEKGDSFPLTLSFAHAGAVEVTATVRAAGATGPASGD